eukprot:20234-Prorocentrum_minimum.AAC.1
MTTILSSGLGAVNPRKAGFGLMFAKVLMKKGSPERVRKKPCRSCDGPIRRRECGYILTTDQSDAGSV